MLFYAALRSAVPTLKMRRMNQHYDVIIAGGGMVGASLAIALAQHGLSVAVADREPLAAQLAPAFDGRVSAVALSSKRLMARLGVWQHLQAQAEPILDIRVSDGDSPFFLDYHHREVGEGPFGWIVENRFIRQALAAAAAEYDNIDVIAPAEITALHVGDHAAEVTLSGGGVLRANLVIGADGKRSRMRALAGIGATTADYAQTAIVCTIAHALPHHGLAQERFLPAGPFAVLPMKDNHSSLVWTERTEHAPLFLALPEEEFVQEIVERVGGYLGDIRTHGPRFLYPLGVLHAKRYAGPRIALIGDAAHSIHPIAGQGVNLGWRDVAVLSELIGRQAGLGLDVGDLSMLRHYERWRRADNLAMLAVTDGLNRLFSNAVLPLKLARGLGLWAVAHLPPLKRFFMRDAMGLTGDLPALMAEEKAA